MGKQRGARQPINDDLDTVIRRCTPLVARICGSRLSGLPAADIEDAIQETFARLAEAKWTDIVNIEAWLIIVAVRVCAQTLRQRYRRQEVPLADPAVVYRVSDALDNVDERVWLATVGSLLPTTDVKLLHMLYVQDLSTKEVANYFRISNGNARVLAYRARQHARLVIEELQ
jgi:RNA polymerase sigma factor (sigma-70 family)